jgi:NTP pyrophosphatase (non-canonical NTP hydrolase)
MRMTFDEYQAAAARTMNPRLTDNERLLDAAAGIAEEAGEVLAHVRKHLYQERALDKEKLAEELGDVLWCVATTAKASGLSLVDIAARNTEKLARRWPDGMPSNR